MPIARLRLLTYSYLGNLIAAIRFLLLKLCSVSLGLRFIVAGWLTRPELLVSSSAWQHAQIHWWICLASSRIASTPPFRFSAHHL